MNKIFEFIIFSFFGLFVILITGITHLFVKKIDKKYIIIIGVIFFIVWEFVFIYRIFIE